jgi:hypothetical protein
MITCEHIDEYLSGAPVHGLPPEMVEHVKQCASCRSLLRALESSGPANPSSRLSARFASELIGDLSPVRPLPRTPRLLLACFLVISLICTWGAWLWGLSGWQAQSPAERILLFGSVLVLLASTIYALTGQMTPGKRTLIPILPVIAAGFAVFAITVLVAFHQTQRPDSRPMNHRCFERGLLVSALTLPLIYAVIRRGALLDRFHVAVNVAAVLASVSLFVLTLYCPVLTVPHVFSAHLGSIAVVLLAGIVLGRAVR